MKIRFLTKKDAEEFRDMLLSDPEASNYLGHSGGGLLNSDHDRWSVTFVIAEKEKLLGFSQVDYYSIPSEARIGATYVVKEARRLGMATRLIKFMEKYAKRNWPIRMITLFTLENKAMEACAKNNGYKKLGVYKDYVYYNGKYSDQVGWIKRIK